MSYGFGVGDFIAVGELIWKLYRNIYQVSRDAPPEIISPHQELSNLSNIVKALQEDALQDGSAIAEASEYRVNLGRELLKATEENLRSLEKLANKYFTLQEPRIDSKSQKEALQRLWRKAQYAEMCGKSTNAIHRNTGLLNLLLLATRNSSFQRIQEHTERLSNNLETIKSSMYTFQQTQKGPSITGTYDEQSRFELTRAFMAKAEVGGKQAICAFS